MQLQAAAPQRALGRWRDDPVGFCRDLLGESLWSKQEEILEAVYERRRVVVTSCFASGKTYTAAHLVAQWVATDPNAIAITTATVGRQVRGQLWGEIRKIHDRGPFRLPSGEAVGLPGALDADLSGLSPGPEPTFSERGLDLPGDLLPKAPEWTVSPYNFALGFATRDPNAFAGWHGGRVLVIFDEAEGLPEEIWDVVEGQLATADVAILALGNPDPNGALGGFYRAAASSLWHHIAISAFDTPNLVAGRLVMPFLVTEEWVEAMRRQWGEGDPRWQTKVLGRFPTAGLRTVISLDAVEAALRASGPVDLGSHETEAGLDVARYGDDDSAISIRQGPVLLWLERTHGFDGPDVAAWAWRIMGRFGCRRVKGDSTGMGGPVLDVMRRYPGCEVVDVDSAASAMDEEQYANARAEMWWGAGERFREARVLLTHPGLPRAELDRLKEDLTAPRYGFDAQGRVRIQPKEEIRKTLGRSPDVGDCFCLCFYAGGAGPASTNISELRGRRVGLPRPR